jgi:aminoglycoside phosphotransferase (APT) family kinase protein
MKFIVMSLQDWNRGRHHEKCGQSNPTFLLSTQDKQYVLRKKSPGTLLPSAHMVEREYRIMKALERTGTPNASVA